jgi:hypothetical protein
LCPTEIEAPLLLRLRAQPGKERDAAVEAEGHVSSPVLSSASRRARRKRRVTLSPPMFLHLRHSFEGIILGFASGRKRLWRSTIRLRAITDRPEVSVLSPRVRLDPERERRSLIRRAFPRPSPRPDGHNLNNPAKSFDGHRQRVDRRFDLSNIVGSGLLLTLNGAVRQDAH